jgi:hypothetical protein
VVEGGLREGSVCGPSLPFKREVEGGHVLLEERREGGRDIGIIGYECKEGVGVVLIRGSGGKPKRRGGHMVLMIAMAPGGGGLKVVRVLMVLGGGGGFVRAGGRCGVVHGGSGGKVGAEEVVEWENGGNEKR